jgi:streptogramin lyase
MHQPKSSSSIFARLLSITVATLLLAGCGHGSAIGAGPGAFSGSGDIIPMLRQHSSSHPNWVRMPDNAMIYGGGGMTVGPDGRIWTTTDSSITRVDYWRTMQAFSASGQSEPAIATGPDGNLWFTEFSVGAIGRLNPTTGKLDSFPDPSGGQPINLIAGPDGDMWFTERDSPGNIIGRISTLGVIKEFSATAGTPDALAAGPDGDVYFSDGRDVGRITPSGQITEQALAFDSASYATGPDGNVYLIDYNGQLQLSRITTGFKIDTYAWPSGGVEPGPMCAGPDGNMWILGTLNNHDVFTLFDVNSQQFLSQSITSPIDNNFLLGGLVTGLDGNIWWTSNTTINVYVYHLISASPDPLTFTAPGQQQTMTASETNFSGTLTATSSNTSIVTVMPGGGPNSFVITSVAPGGAFIRIFDGHHNNLGVKAVVH